jgi:hypothetical protein
MALSKTFNQSSMTRIKLLKRDITLVSERLLIMKQQKHCIINNLHIPDLILILYSFFYIFIRVISLPEGLMVAFYATGMARTKTIAHNYNFCTQIEMMLNVSIFIEFFSETIVTGFNIFIEFFFRNHSNRFQYLYKLFFRNHSNRFQHLCRICFRNSSNRFVLS